MGKKSISQSWTLIKIYQGRQFELSDLFTLFIPGLCAIFGSFCYGGYLYLYAYQKYGPVASKSWSQLWFILSMIATIIFLTLLFYRLLIARRYAAVYEEGLELNLKKSQIAIWKDISGVTAISFRPYFFWLQLPPIQSGTIYYRNGETIQIQDNILNAADLLTQIKAKVYPILIQTFENDFRSGKKLSFGPIILDKQHIFLTNSGSAQTQEYSWQEIKQINLHSGNLMIEFLNFPNESIPAAEIPNIEIMLQIIKSEISA